MAWSLVLIAICEVATSQGIGENKRMKARAAQKRDQDGGEGGLAEQSNDAPKSDRDMKEVAFRRLWESNIAWIPAALMDAISFARVHQPRVEESSDGQEEFIREVFKGQLWPSLLGRGWKVIDEDDEDGMETYVYDKRKFTSPSVIMNEVVRIHPELRTTVVALLNKIEQSRLQLDQRSGLEKAQELALTVNTVNLKSLQKLIGRYAPKQLLHDRTRKAYKIPLRNKTLNTCFYINGATEIMKALRRAPSYASDPRSDDDKLCELLGTDARSGLPHPLWTRKHDAILIRSVAKHGWVDIDSNLKQIVNDKDIKWGFPFEETGSAPVQRIGNQEMKNLRDTAERAASILNEKPKVLEILTGFNKKLGECLGNKICDWWFAFYLFFRTVPELIIDSFRCRSIFVAPAFMCVRML